MKYLLVIVMLAVSAFAEKPVAELPRAQIDTTYHAPEGKKWAAHTSEELTNALAKSAPGDVIVLDAGATYTGGFQLPAKANPQHKWIYVISSQLAKPARGPAGFAGQRRQHAEGREPESRRGISVQFRCEPLAVGWIGDHDFLGSRRERNPQPD